jgi:peptidoglycan/xylan/chitin deacetylase (PgdA/CDA1 family)
MYHRVAPEEDDPWGLVVTPERFEQQLEILRKRAVPLSLEGLVEGLAAHRLPERSAVITFDDGYVDTLRYAKPILERLGLPATVFVTTGYIGGHREFWWDELYSLLAQPVRLPAALELGLGGRRVVFELGPAAAPPAEFPAIPIWQAPPGSRRALCREVWALLQPLGEALRRSALDQIRAWAGAGAVRSSANHRPMTADEVRQVGEGGLIEVGAHSVTHPLLPAMPPEIQRDEIRGSKVALDDLLGCPVRSFSYPFGAWNPTTEELTREAGFRCAVAAHEEPAWSAEDRFRLPRYNVENWDGAEFSARLNQWW